MKLIKKIQEGERIDAAIIGWKIYHYTDVHALQLSIYLKWIIFKINIGIPTGKDPNRL